jgi:orotidine-5'-phosphate decarboxylase
MRNRNFREMMEAQWAKNNPVCVGLDSRLDRIPRSMLLGNSGYRLGTFSTMANFNRKVLEFTKDLAGYYKLNPAFYQAEGSEGVDALRQGIKDIHEIAPGIPAILDGKLVDVPYTNESYAYMAFDLLKADAVTVDPYMGGGALEPFLRRADKGIFFLCRTSNPDAGEFQDLHTLNQDPRGKPEGLTAQEWLQILCNNSMRLYERVAFNVTKKWNGNGNCGLVVGATNPGEIRRVREIAGDDMSLLIPAFGRQGGNLKKAIGAGRNSRGNGIIVSSSSGLIFVSECQNFAEATRRETEKLRDLTNLYLS